MAIQINAGDGITQTSIYFLCELTTSSKLKEHEEVENANAESTAAIIRDLNPDQGQNENFRNQQDKSKNVNLSILPSNLNLLAHNFCFHVEGFNEKTPETKISKKFFDQN